MRLNKEEGYSHVTLCVAALSVPMSLGAWSFTRAVRLPMGEVEGMKLQISLTIFLCPHTAGLMLICMLDHFGTRRPAHLHHD